MTITQHSWEDIVSQKRSARDQRLMPYLVDVDDRLPQVQHVDARSRLDQKPEVQEITDIDNIGELLQGLEQGKFGAEQVVKAYIRRYGDLRRPLRL